MLFWLALFLGFAGWLARGGGGIAALYLFLRGAFEAFSHSLIFGLALIGSAIVVGIVSNAAFVALYALSETLISIKTQQLDRAGPQ